MLRDSSLGLLERPAVFPEETSLPRASAAPRRVLIIDDHPLVLDLVSHLLRHAEYVVERADGGPEGIQKLRAAPPDLVLTDLCMPGASGWEVAKVAKGLQPPVPVILMTGSGEVVDRNPEGRSLVDAVILKPFGMKELLELVWRILGCAGGKAATFTKIRAAAPPLVTSPLLSGASTC